jgi:hypothetical protein
MRVLLDHVSPERVSAVNGNREPWGKPPFVEIAASVCDEQERNNHGLSIINRRVLPLTDFLEVGQCALTIGEVFRREQESSPADMDFVAIGQSGLLRPSG